MAKNFNDKFLERNKWLFFIGLAAILLWLLIKRFLLPNISNYLMYTIIIVIVVGITLLIRLNYLNYIKDLSKATEQEVNQMHISYLRAPWVYILFLFLGAFSLYSAFFNYSQKLPPKPFLIIFGVILLFGAIYGWLNRKRNVEQARQSKPNLKSFKVSKNAAIFIAVWLVFSNFAYAWFHLSWTQGFILALAGLIAAGVYYQFFKNR